MGGLITYKRKTIELHIEPPLKLLQNSLGLVPNLQKASSDSHLSSYLRHLVLSRILMPNDILCWQENS